MGLLFENLYVDFVPSSKDILSQIHGSSSDICVHVETSYFVIFQNVLGTKKNI